MAKSERGRVRGDRETQYNMTLGGTIAHKFQVDSTGGWVVLLLRGCFECVSVRVCECVCAVRRQLFNVVAHIPLLPFIACLLCSA